MTFLSINEMTSAISLADSLDAVIPNKQSSVEHFPGYRLLQLGEEAKVSWQWYFRWDIFITETDLIEVTLDCH